MKRHLALLVASTMFAAIQSYAREPQAPPTPTGSPERAIYKIETDAQSRENVFIGHYGEILRLRQEWAAEAVMRGPMEIVYMREKAYPDPSKWPAIVKDDKDGITINIPRPAFQIHAEEFVPENFARLRLMQLMVIPKNVPGGFRTLEKLREAKSGEFAAKGDAYKLQDAGEHRWPRESFWVSVSTPYRLFQLYTQDEKNFFIYSSGASPFAEKDDDEDLRVATDLSVNSLSAYLSDYTSDLHRKNAAPRDLADNLWTVFLPVIPVFGIALALAILPGDRSWLNRLRLIGRASAGFIGAWLLVAGPMLFTSWRLGFDRVVNEASILTCAAILMPWICKFVSTRLGNSEARRVFVWSAIANILPASAGVWGMQDFLAGAAVITDYQDFFVLTSMIAVLGLLNGVVFALTHQPKKSSLSGIPS